MSIGRIGEALDTNFAFDTPNPDNNAEADGSINRWLIVNNYANSVIRPPSSLLQLVLLPQQLLRQVLLQQQRCFFSSSFFSASVSVQPQQLQLQQLLQPLPSFSLQLQPDALALWLSARCFFVCSWITGISPMSALAKKLCNTVGWCRTDTKPILDPLLVKLHTIFGWSLATIGLYEPTRSIKRPSRERRESAITMR